MREELGFSLAGEGEHLYIEIQKRNENTAWIAQKLAGFFQLKLVDVGYSGLKDRRAVTRQWFSLPLVNTPEEADWQAFVAASEADCTILQWARHSRKLKRGMHASNHFRIRLRDLDDFADAAQRLQDIQSKGVPNYFGEQRFGRQGNNLVAAQEWIDGRYRIKDRNKKSLIMSAARSQLFNLVLSARVAANNWHTALAGEALLNDMPSGPLWGRGKSAAQDLALEIENQALANWSEWMNKLEHVGLNHERRSLVLRPLDLSWEQEAGDLLLSFSLPPGEFATSVLRELCQLEQGGADSIATENSAPDQDTAAQADDPEHM